MAVFLKYDFAIFGEYARFKKYIFLFDPKGHPEHQITNRLFNGL